jgi:hypothetical protein
MFTPTDTWAAMAGALDTPAATAMTNMPVIMDIDFFTMAPYEATKDVVNICPAVVPS